MRRAFAYVGTALVAAGLLAGCGSTKTVHLTAQDGPAATGGNGITPVPLTAKKGEKVEIKVTNTDKSNAHGFSIDNYNVVKTIESGKTETISFTADKTGTYKVFCQLHPKHVPSQLVVT